MNKKAYEELELRDDYMFGAVMSIEENCKRLLEIVLNIKIARLEYTETQKTISLAYDSKGIRLDVFVTDEKGNAYTVEMQTTADQNLPKRSRYYHALTDLSLLSRGADYERLPANILIFICTFDPLGDGRYIYRFRNICTDGRSTELNDGTVKIFLNTKGSRGKISRELKALLDYIDGGAVTDSYTKKLDSDVLNIKIDRNRRLDYMKYELNMLDARKEGIAIGEKQGEERFRLLLKKLVADDRLSELENPDLDLNGLFEEYGIR